MNQKGNVLIVDDELSIREACRKILLKEGLHVDVAEDGLEAKEKIERENFDLVLIDLKLPHLSGEDLLHWLRSFNPDIVPVIITGYPSFDSAVSAIREGAYDYIPKPFTSGELRRIVRRGLERKFLIQEMHKLREEQEKNLKLISQEKTKLKSVINSMADGVLVVNRYGKVVLYNSAIRHILNLSGNCLDKSLEEVIKCQTLIRLVNSQLKEKKKKVFSQEIDINNRDYLVNVASVSDNGEKLGVVVSFRDVTKLRKLADMKSAFLNMVSHEIRSPLSIIEGYLDVVLKGIVKDENQIKSMIERVKVRTQTLRELTDDLLNLARMESEKIKRELVPINLQEVILEMVEFYKDKAREKEIKININIEPVPSIMADRNDIALLFTNLLDNAIKYNVRGGSVDIHVKKEGFDLCVKIKDSGVGIPKESIKLIFDEFYRVKNEKTRMVPGTGLGLSIVQKIVKAYRGKIKVTSKEGEGSSFSVYLPLENLCRGLEYD